MIIYSSVQFTKQINTTLDGLSFEINQLYQGF